jgi:hypothetical protein
MESAFNVIVNDTKNVPEVGDNIVFIRTVPGVHGEVATTHSSNLTNLRAQLSLLFTSCIQLDLIWFKLELLFRSYGLNNELTMARPMSFMDKMFSLCSFTSHKDRRDYRSKEEMDTVIELFKDMYVLFVAVYSQFLRIRHVDGLTLMDTTSFYNELCSMSPHFRLYRSFFTKFLAIHDLVNNPRSVYARACIFKDETIISESIVIGNAYGRKMFKWATFRRMVDNLVDLPEFTLPTSVHSIS